jgi:hypothetical protein
VGKVNSNRAFAAAAFGIDNADDFLPHGANTVLCTLFGCTTYSKQEGFRSKTVGVRPQTPGVFVVQ